MDGLRSWLERQDEGWVFTVGLYGGALMLLYLFARLVMHPTERRLDRIARALERRASVPGK